MPRFPRLPQSLLKPPKGFRKPDVKNFQGDMHKLSVQIAEEFRQTIIDNIEKNAYGFDLAESTVARKGSDTPLIDTHELVDNIYREDTVVSVRDTPRSDSRLTNKELAIVLEYGTKDKHIPARPVWRNTYRDFRKEAKKKIESFFKENGKF